MKKIILMLVVLCCASTTHAQQFYDVTKYGAKKDSSAKATAAIAKAIDAASKAGGGTVYFPAGKYLTGPIHLKSNIVIFIDAGAELHFSDDFDDYLPMVESRYEGVDLKSFSPLFYAWKVENITITGRGKINGHGKKWWDYVLNFPKDQPRNKWQLAFDAANKDIILSDDSAQTKRGFLRPPFIQPMYCKNILIEGITITNSPFWTINPEFCENITVNGVTIDNPKSPNTDGINAESCKYVHVSNCHISVGDDCITIKSGKDLPGRTKNMPAENYTITNCTMLNGHGGVVIGSEMSGGVKKIVITNCVFDGTDRGIRIKTTRGRGGIVEDIRVDNIVMKNIKQQAIVLDMQYTRAPAEPVSERTPQFRNIRLSNITAYTKQAMYINGLDEMPVQEISLNDCVFEAETGIVIKNAKDIELHNVRVNTKTGSALTVDKTQRLDIDGLTSAKPVADVPLIKLNNVQDILLRNCWPFNGTKIFAAINGTETKNVKLLNNELGEAAVVYGDEVKK
ncbi:glycoside hydrolase family 28 protein [Ferruginibacter profundus]